MHLEFLNYKLLYLFYFVWMALADGRTIDLYSARKDIYEKVLRMRTLPFQDCGSRYDLLYVHISSCSSIPCQMIRGSTVMVKGIFDDNGEQLSFLKHRVRWIFNAIKTEAFITPDPCDDNHHCLVNGSDEQSYDAEVFVNYTLPNIRGTMMWMAVNPYNEQVICFKIPIFLIDKEN